MFVFLRRAVIGKEDAGVVPFFIEHFTHTVDRLKADISSQTGNNHTDCFRFLNSQASGHIAGLIMQRFDGFIDLMPHFFGHILIASVQVVRDRRRGHAHIVRYMLYGHALAH